MNAPSEAVWASDCQRLVELTRAQAAVIARGDLREFAALYDERARLQDSLERHLTEERRPVLHDVLLQLQVIDQRTRQLAERLLAETARELARVRQGQTALDAYGRPGLHLVAGHPSIDRAG